MLDEHIAEMVHEEINGTYGWMDGCGGGMVETWCHVEFARISVELSGGVHDSPTKITDRLLVSRKPAPTASRTP